MKRYRFYKEGLIWYIDLPYWPFAKRHLMMVAGADYLLDVLSKGESEVTLDIDSTPFPYSDGWLVRREKLGTFEGAIYDVRNYYTGFSFHPPSDSDYPHSMLWLCPVTLWVFLKYPKKIYFKVVKEDEKI